MKRRTYDQINARLQELDMLHEHTPAQMQECIDLENAIDDIHDEDFENRI